MKWKFLPTPIIRHQEIVAQNVNSEINPFLNYNPYKHYFRDSSRYSAAAHLHILMLCAPLHEPSTYLLRLLCYIIFYDIKKIRNYMKPTSERISQNDEKK